MLSSFDMQEDLRQIYQAANRNNVSIYAVDPRGLATSEFNIAENINSRTDREYLNSTMDTLRVMAEQTDGRAILNRNDLTLAMKQIVRDASAYYLLGYSSASAPTDGKFHEIKVRIRRPGVQVRSRKGYWAVSPADVERMTKVATAAPVPKPVQNALASLAYPTRMRVIRTWIGAERGENGKTRMTFVWEANRAPGAPGARDRAAGARVGNRRRHRRLAVFPRARAGRGAKHGRSPGAGSRRGRRARDLRSAARSDAAAALRRGGRRASAGLRIARGDGSGSHASTIFGTPAIYRARTARDIQQFRANRDLAPTAVREFLRTDRLLIRVPRTPPGQWRRRS